MKLVVEGGIILAMFTVFAIGGLTELRPFLPIVGALGMFAIVMLAAGVFGVGVATVPLHEPCTAGAVEAP